MKGRLRPLAAALLSGFVATGLGHLFAGYPRRAIALLFAPFVVMAWGIVCFRFAGGSAWRLAIALIAAVAPLLVIAADAWRLARRGRRLPIARALRFACYAGFTVASMTFGAFLSRYVREHWLEPIFIPSHGMIPALLPGDRFMVDRRAYAAQTPALGDVVMYRASAARWIARVAALPGDTVPGENGVVEADHYFLLGDNRDQSVDSRQLGAIPRADILGRVLYLTFSIDPETGAFRPERIGTVVK